jgi:hypothetical protein
VTHGSTTAHVVVDIIGGVVGLGVLTALCLLFFSLISVYGGRLSVAGPAPDRGGGQKDPAWPSYLRRQHKLDFAAACRSSIRLYDKAFKRWWAKFPLFIITWPVLACAGIFLSALIAVFYLTQLAVWIVADVSYWLTAGAVRLADTTYAQVRRAQASCPVCYEVMDRPAYKCVGCGALHRDIRAGRLGSVYRACACGRRLPCGVLRAAWQLDAACQRCGARMHRGAAVLRDVRVPVFGEPQAGKTRLIYAGFYDIAGRANAHGWEACFPDESSQARADSGIRQIISGQRTAQTGWPLEPALTCQIGRGTKGALLHAFDAAGDRFRRADGHDELRYFEDGHTLVFVVDPFTVPGLRRVIAAQPRTDLINEYLPAHPRNPDDAYGEVVSRLLSSGTRTREQRLAVVVSRADVLLATGITPPNGSERIRGWLYDNGLHNVVLAAGREFKDVRYFAVASVDGTQAPQPYAPAAPFIWALSTRGFNLLDAPADPVQAAVPVKEPVA